MADFKFVSLRFENYSSDSEKNYSIFITTDEGEDPVLVWYDGMGDPIAEVSVGNEDLEKLCELCDSCEVRKWDGFNEIGDLSKDCFSFEAEDADGNILWCEGTGAFPDDFDEFEKGIRSIFSGYVDM
jgi:hypothetical protein